MKNVAADYIYKLVILLSLFTGVFVFGFLFIWLIKSSGEFAEPHAALEFLLGTVWSPENGKFGVFYMLVSSLTTAFLSALVSSVVSILAAGFIFVYFPKKAAERIISLTSVLSGIPSVLFGLIGMTVIVPWLGNNIELAKAGGGASLMAAAAVLSFMLIPVMTVTCYEGLISADKLTLYASDALGATKTETLFNCAMPMIRKIRKTAFANAFRRAVGEATAVILVSGNVTGKAGFFYPVRTLAGTVVLEMGYADKTHRSALFAIGLLLLVITMLIPSGRDED